MYCTNCGANGGPMHVHNGMNFCSYECIDEQEEHFEDLKNEAELNALENQTYEG